MKKKIDLSEIIKKRGKQKISKPISKKKKKNQINKKKQKEIKQDNGKDDSKKKGNQVKKQIKTSVKKEISQNHRIRMAKTKKIDEMTETKEFVGFLLNNEEYCIDSDYVRQIIKYRKPIDVGIKSELVNGIVNTKDGVLAVIDLRKRLNLEESNRKDGSIIIVNYENVRVGIFVNYLIGIVRLESDNIKNIPSFLPEHQMQYIKGVGLKKDGKIVIVLDHNKLLSEEDIREIKSIPEDYK